MKLSVNWKFYFKDAIHEVRRCGGSYNFSEKTEEETIDCLKNRFDPLKKVSLGTILGILYVFGVKNLDIILINPKDFEFGHKVKDFEKEILKKSKLEGIFPIKTTEKEIYKMKQKLKQVYGEKYDKVIGEPLKRFDSWVAKGLIVLSKSIMEENDVVKLKRNLPKYRLKRGETGTIIFLPSRDKVREVQVEFSDKTGRPYATEFINVKDIEVIWSLNNKGKEKTKYNLRDLRKKLSQKELIEFSYENKLKNDIFRTFIRMWRLDLRKDESGEYPEEKYCLLVEKGNIKYYFEEGNLVIDERHEFNKVEEIIKYLDKKGYLKRGEWIKDD